MFTRFCFEDDWLSYHFCARLLDTLTHHLQPPHLYLFPSLDTSPTVSTEVCFILFQEVVYSLSQIIRVLLLFYKILRTVTIKHFNFYAGFLDRS